MASKKKILANRKNSLKSTGPKTVNGKFKSSLNSIKHGLYAEKIAVIGENIDEVNEFIERLVNELNKAKEEYLNEILEVFKEQN